MRIKPRHFRSGTAPTSRMQLAVASFDIRLTALLWNPALYFSRRDQVEGGCHGARNTEEGVLLADLLLHFMRWRRFGAHRVLISAAVQILRYLACSGKNSRGHAPASSRFPRSASETSICLTGGPSFSLPRAAGRLWRRPADRRDPRGVLQGEHAAKCERHCEHFPRS